MKYIKEAKERNTSVDKLTRETVADIIDGIREGGDKALLEYCEKFDGRDVGAAELLRVSPFEIAAAYEQVDRELIKDMAQAAISILGFAEAQKESLSEVHDFSPREGVFLGHRIIPVESCLCYIPGGNYPLYSTALMLIIPAKEAGVKRVVACSPVDKETGRINPKTLVAMDIAGADEIYGIGGAHAIAAFSYGTESIAPVDLIVGPGNKYVAEAKRQCYGQVGIDFVAGPSEVMVIADGSGDPSVVAADILAQCEHDVNAKGIVVTTNEEFGNKVIAAVEEELRVLETAEIARVSWEDNGEVIVTESMDEAIELANAIAPEHLELNIRDSASNPASEMFMKKLNNYGSLFIGQNTAEVFGDYASGPNHTLPTVRAARYTGGLWVGTFLKTVTYQYMSDKGSQDLAPIVKRLAEGEGLAAHALAAAKREKEE